MARKKVYGWAVLGVWAALIAYAVASYMHRKTIRDVNDLMKGLQHYAATTFRGIE